MEVPPQRQNGDGQRARPLRRQPHRRAAGRGETAYRHRQPAVFTARQALDDGEIVQVLPEWDFLSSYHGGLWLLYAPNQYLPPKLRVFIDYLVACLAQEPQLKRLA